MDIMIKLIDELMIIYKDGYLMLVGMFKHYIQFWVWNYLCSSYYFIHEIFFDLCCCLVCRLAQELINMVTIILGLN
jgi:hypothetical protein